MTTEKWDGTECYGSIEINLFKRSEEKGHEHEDADEEWDKFNLCSQGFQDALESFIEKFLDDNTLLFPKGFKIGLRSDGEEHDFLPDNFEITNQEE